MGGNCLFTPVLLREQIEPRERHECDAEGSVRSGSDDWTREQVRECGDWLPGLQWKQEGTRGERQSDSA